MKKTFSAASVATLVVLFNNGYSFGEAVDNQLAEIAAGNITVEGNETIDFHIPNDEAMALLIQVTGIAAEDEALENERPQIEELVIALAELSLKEEKNATVTLTPKQMMILCLLETEHGLLDTLSAEANIAMEDYPEGIPEDTTNFSIEDVSTTDAEDAIAMIASARENPEFDAFGEELDALVVIFEQLCGDGEPVNEQED
ncbi:MAG: hypothetical protein NTX91_05145 [candidate division SR1 bacterium]|nr:hypothetical protein [candidate division SR1 bacterium]